ncbi:MAG: SCO family protein [Stenotrophomonas sp.]|uniref:SCO family protein n=1 Tax=Stenotrophomonas sp. TaxID=69392 RepID=UPI003D6CA3AA
MSRYSSPASGLAALARKLRLSTVLLTAASLLLVACAAKPKVDYYGKDIACEALGQHWSMPDSSGVTRTPADFNGKVTYLFFGFTSCPDVCPTTMVELNRVKHLMGSDADNLQVVFVTVDPARDTPAVAETYVKAFDPTATALVGNDQQLAAMASSFKAFYDREDGTLPGTYTMSHTSGGYVFDRQGRLRLFAPFGMPVEQLFSDIQRLTLEPTLPVGQRNPPGCSVEASS